MANLENKLYYLINTFLPMACFSSSSCFQDSLKTTLFSSQTGSETFLLIMLETLGWISRLFFECWDLVQPILDGIRLFTEIAVEKKLFDG